MSICLSRVLRQIIKQDRLQRVKFHRGLTLFQGDINNVVLRYDSCPHFFQSDCISPEANSRQKWASISHNPPQGPAAAKNNPHTSLFSFSNAQSPRLFSTLHVNNAENVDPRGRDEIKSDKREGDGGEQLCYRVISFSCWFGDTGNKIKTHHRACTWSALDGKFCNIHKNRFLVAAKTTSIAPWFCNNNLI